MNKYLVILTAPSLGLWEQPYDYIHPYLVSANSNKEVHEYIDDKLSRKFSLDYKVPLTSVETIFVSKVKTVV